MIQVRKLLVFTENYAQGGGNRYLVDLVNSISFKYREILIFSNKGGLFDCDIARLNCRLVIKSLSFITFPFIVSRFKISNVRLLGIVKLFFFLIDPIALLLNVIIFLLFLVKSNPTQILVCNGGYPASRASLAMVFGAKLLNIPVVMSVVSSPVPRKSLVSYYEKLIDLLVWFCVSKVIVNANFIAFQLIKLRDLTKNKVSIIYNGLENIEHSIILNRPSDSLQIGCIARADKEKGVFYLLDAFNVLVSKYPFLKLTIVGSGNASDELAKKINSMGLTDKVYLPGHYSGDVSLLLSDFDIYAFPSLWEGFPYSILEAMRSGCAIVSSNVGGISEAITNGVDGILVEPASSEDLVLGLAKLIEDRKLRYKIANNARRKFEDKFTLNQMACAVKKIL